MGVRLQRGRGREGGRGGGGGVEGGRGGGGRRGGGEGEGERGWESYAAG